MRRFDIIAAAALASLGASRAYAGNPHNNPPSPLPAPSNLRGCTTQQVITSTTVLACNGYYAGNILNTGGGNTATICSGSSWPFRR